MVKKLCKTVKEIGSKRKYNMTFISNESILALGFRDAEAYVCYKIRTCGPCSIRRPIMVYILVMIRTQLVE